MSESVSFWEKSVKVFGAGAAGISLAQIIYGACIRNRVMHSKGSCFGQLFPILWGQEQDGQAGKKVFGEKIPDVFRHFVFRRDTEQL